MKTQLKKEIRKQLTIWYANHQRTLPWRASRDPYHIWVSEVMLQQTQVATVIPYYHDFLGRFPDIRHLAKAEEQSVLKNWEGLGYYARARNLHKAAKIVSNEYDGKVPLRYETFRSLPGVGDYIAAAVLSIADGQSYPVVDGNVKRVFARLFCMASPVNKPASHRLFLEPAQQLLNTADPGTHNQAVMELGALVCKPRQPLCQECPLNRLCCARKKSAVGDYPKRVKSKATPLVRVVCGVIFKENRILIVQRKPDGLLGGLWEFPGGRIESGRPQKEKCLAKIKIRTGLDVAPIKYLTEVTHAYTHFKIRMKVYLCRYISGNLRLDSHVDHRWVSLEELSDFPIPKAHLKFIPLLKPLAHGGKMPDM